MKLRDAPTVEAGMAIAAIGRQRRWRWLAIGLGCVAGLLLLLAAFPWGLVAGAAAGPLSRTLGREVTIGSARRLDWIGMTPTVELRDVRVAQPDWARPGAMARIAAARVRAPVLPLLWGDLRLRALELDGLRLDLRREASGRSNWASEAKPDDGAARRPPELTHLTVRDARIRLADAKRRVTLDATLVSDEASGLALRAKGEFRGRPISLAAGGPALAAADPEAPYPVQVELRSPLASLSARARMARPLDRDRFTADFRAWGPDLSYLDDLLEAGLFPTQDFALSGRVRHERPEWRVERLAGRIGRSRLSAKATIRDAGARTRIDAAVDADTLDFGDLSSDRQQARAAAKTKRTGRRVIPDTRIALDALAKIDGRLVLNVRRLLPERAPFEALSATAVLDDRRLTIEPLDVVLKSGRLSGRLVVDDRGKAPRLTSDVRIGGATIQGLLLGGSDIVGPMRARIRLAGSGPTVRRAMARASGEVGLVVTGGSVRRDYATFLGGDVFKSIGTAVSGGDGRVPLRCLVARFRAKGGRLAPDPLVLDATIARGDGGGSITLADERIDLSVRGRARDPGLIQSTTPARVIGTLSDPEIDVRPPRSERGKTGLFGRIGAFVKGLKTRGDDDRARPAAPVDCGRLVGLALG